MRELTPTSRPETRAEAIEMAQRWGGSGPCWSHWNDCLASPYANEGEKAVSIAACHWADAAEVQRLAALASVLP